MNKLLLITAIFFLLGIMGFVSAYCTDTDGGKNYNIRGAALGYQDTCIVDFFEMTADGNGLLEYYCENDTRQSENITCLCYNGVCIGTEATINCNTPVVANSINELRRCGNNVIVEEGQWIGLNEYAVLAATPATHDFYQKIAKLVFISDSKIQLQNLDGTYVKRQGSGENFITINGDGKALNFPTENPPGSYNFELNNNKDKIRITWGEGTIYYSSLYSQWKFVGGGIGFNKTFFCPGVCSGGQCSSLVPVCQKSCVNKECGDDGCCGSCGTCAYGKMCNNSKCTDISLSNTSCTENWQCSNWGSCINEQQTRLCSDYNNCGTITNKPLTARGCDSSTPIEENQPSVQVQQPNISQNEQSQSIIKSEVYISNKKVTIEKNEGKSIIRAEDLQVATTLKVVEEFSKVYIQTSSGKKVELKMLPEEAKNKATKIENAENLEIGEENGNVVYIISGTKQARLLFLFPIEARVEQKIDIKNGEVVSTKKPWWHIFALGI